MIKGASVLDSISKRLTTVCTRTLPLRGIAGDTGR
jgi:hypothetical protein